MTDYNVRCEVCIEVSLRAFVIVVNHARIIDFIERNLFETATSDQHLSHLFFK